MSSPLNDYLIKILATDQVGINVILCIFQVAIIFSVHRSKAQFTVLFPKFTIHTCITCCLNANSSQSILRLFTLEDSEA